jgi:hypothetical protein
MKVRREPTQEKRAKCCADGVHTALEGIDGVETQISKQRKHVLASCRSAVDVLVVEFLML